MSDDLQGAKVLFQTETSLLGYSYQVVETDSFAVVELLNGKLFDVEFFETEDEAVDYFNDRKTTLKVIK